MNNKYILLDGSKHVISSLSEIRFDFAQLSSQNPIAVAQYRRSIANKFFIEHSGRKEKIKQIDDLVVSSFFDDFKIPVRTYNVTKNTEDIVLFAHGGGWMQGNIDAYDYVYRKVAKELNKNVLAIDYRLSPEYRHPIPLNDVLSVYLWASEKCNNVYLAGDSAGGNLCAATCIKLQKLNKSNPNALLLFYPVLGTNFRTESYEKYGDLVPLLQRTAMYYYTQYTGKKYAIDSVIIDKCISPILENDMSVFPDTIIVSAGCDVLLSDQIEFKNKMKDRCTQIIVDGAIHGFLSYGKEFEQINTDVLKSASDWLSKI